MNRAQVSAVSQHVSASCFYRGRFDVATLRALLSLRHFEAEIQFVPVEDPEDVLRKKEKCYNRFVCVCVCVCVWHRCTDIIYR